MTLPTSTSRNICAWILGDFPMSGTSRQRAWNNCASWNESVPLWFPAEPGRLSRNPPGAGAILEQLRGLDAPSRARLKPCVGVPRRKPHRDMPALTRTPKKPSTAAFRRKAEANTCKPGRYFWSVGRFGNSPEWTFKARIVPKWGVSLHRYLGGNWSLRHIAPRRSSP